MIRSMSETVDFPPHFLIFTDSLSIVNSTWNRTISGYIWTWHIFFQLSWIYFNGVEPLPHLLTYSISDKESSTSSTHRGYRQALSLSIFWHTFFGFHCERPSHGDSVGDKNKKLKKNTFSGYVYSEIKIFRTARNRGDRTETQDFERRPGNPRAWDNSRDSLCIIVLDSPRSGYLRKIHWDTQNIYSIKLELVFLKFISSKRQRKVFHLIDRSPSIFSQQSSSPERKKATLDFIDACIHDRIFQ